MNRGYFLKIDKKHDAELPKFQKPLRSSSQPNNSYQITQIFNKISDISDKTQINDAMNEAQTMKTRVKLLDLIINRKRELEELTQFMNFQNIGNLLHNIKGKLMKRLTSIREKKTLENQGDSMRKLSFFSNNLSPKSKFLVRKESSNNSSDFDNSTDFLKMLKNPQAIEMVLKLYKALQKKKNNDKDLLVKTQPKPRFFNIFDSIHHKKEFEHYQDFIKKYLDVKNKQEIFNKIRLEHLKKMEKVTKEKKAKKAKIQMENDLCSFFIKNNEINKETKEKMMDFFVSDTNNKEINKLQENVKGKLSKILSNSNFAKINYNLGNLKKSNGRIGELNSYLVKNQKKIEKNSFSIGNKRIFESNIKEKREKKLICAHLINSTTQNSIKKNIQRQFIYIYIIIKHFFAI